MRPGTYKTPDGRTVRVQQTPTGWLLRYSDGEVMAVSA